MGGRGCGIACFAQRRNLFSGHDESKRFRLNGIQVQIFVYSPLWTKHIHRIARLAPHLLGIQYDASCLRMHGRTHFPKDVHAGLRMSSLPPCPRPVPETFVIEVGNGAARHCLPFGDEVADDDDSGKGEEEAFAEFLHKAVSENDGLLFGAKVVIILRRETVYLLY